MTAMLAPLLETARRTTPRYILLFTITLVVTYLITHVINMITAPINASYAVWIGTLLILITAAAGLTITATLALDQSEGEPASLPAAANNLPRALRALAFITAAATLILVSTLLAGYTGLAISIFLITWLTPLTLYPLMNEDGNPFSLTAEGIRTTVQHASKTLPLAAITLALNALAVLTIIGVLYTFPYTTIAQGILYRDIYSDLD